MVGANAIYGLGLQEGGMTMDAAQLVFDNEVARMVRFVTGGIPINDETLSVDAIKEIGSSKDFLMHPSTLKYVRSQSKPEIIDRKNRSKWEADGSKDAAERATEKARWIIENHEVKSPISKEARSEIEKILASAEKDLGY
jgi:trimethylamine--corrinoid protein Co-methyltransferase